MGRGKGAGTGYPHHFRCQKCRRRYSTAEYHGERYSEDRGRRNRIMLTGKARPNHSHRMSVRSSRTVRQYRCEDCGHVGWSNHIELQRLEEPSLKVEQVIRDLSGLRS
jgi:predicted RNA-binding Zn-ribbon protein involved in translation (DUF1610 family)